MTEELTLLGEVIHANDDGPRVAIGVHSAGETEFGEGEVEKSRLAEPQAEARLPLALERHELAPKVAQLHAARPRSNSTLRGADERAAAQDRGPAARATSNQLGAGGQPKGFLSVKGGRRRSMGPRAWLLQVVAAFLVGGLGAAALVHLASVSGAVAGEGRTPLDTVTLRGADASADALQPPDRSGASAFDSSLAAATSELAPGELVALERAAALALRRDDCHQALPLYRQLASMQPAEKWSFAVRLLEQRCEPRDVGLNDALRPSVRQGESLLRVDFESRASVNPEEVELHVFHGGALKEVLPLAETTWLTLPSTGAELRLQLRCPDDQAASERRLPHTLPPLLRARLACPGGAVHRLVAFVVAGDPAHELELVDGSERRLTTNGGVTHVLLRGDAGETFSWRAVVPDGLRVDEPEQWMSLESDDDFAVATFRIERPAPSPKLGRAKRRRSLTPYRL